MFRSTAIVGFPVEANELVDTLIEIAPAPVVEFVYDILDLVRHIIDKLDLWIDELLKQYRIN